MSLVTLFENNLLFTGPFRKGESIGYAPGATDYPSQLLTA